MGNRAGWLMVVATAIAATGCAGQASRPADDGAKPAAAERRDAPAKDEEAATRVPPPANSKLAKVKEGMTMSQVAEILGQPTDQNQHVTGKAFIPWYYGDDAMRIAWHYKGVGRVIFTGGGAYGQRGGEVQWVEYDPQETGYRR